MRLLFISLFISTLCFGQYYNVYTGDNKYKWTPTTIDVYGGLYWPTDELPKAGTISEKQLKVLSDAIKAKSIYGSDTLKVDSLEIKSISIKELESYLQRISIVAMKQFDLTEKAKYDNIFKELQAIYLEADKKRKQK